MADAYVQVPPDSTGKKIETHEETDDAGNTVERQVITLGDVAAALYQVLQALQRPVSVDPLTGRQRIVIESTASGVSMVVSLATIGGVTPRDMMTFQLERQAWASNVGERIA